VVRGSLLSSADDWCAGRRLVDDQHDSQHDQEDCEDRAERNDYTFTEGVPASGLLSSVFGADV
jgi:hypothetical protein